MPAASTMDSSYDKEERPATLRGNASAKSLRKAPGHREERSGSLLSIIKI